MNIDGGFGKMKAKLFLKSAASALACILAQGIAAGMNMPCMFKRANRKRSMRSAKRSFSA